MALLSKVLIGLWTNIVNAPKHTNYILLSNQKCMTQPTLILHPDEWSQEFYCYPFAVKLEDVLEVVILLMSYPIKFVFQIKSKI